jgi:hypothetical protein
MTQLMRMHPVLEAGGFAEPGDHVAKAARGERRAAFGRKHIGRRRVLVALEPAQRPQLSPRQRMRGSLRALHPADMQAALAEIDRVPPQRYRLDRTQPVVV